MHKDIARSLYFSIQRFRGEPVVTALADVRKTEFVSVDELKHLQAKRQQAQLSFVVELVPFYRRAYRPLITSIQQAHDWNDINKIMQELPTVSKDYVRENREEFLAQNNESLKTYPSKTSGSSGTPLTFPCDQKAWAYRHALIFRNMEAFGVSIGEPYLYIFGLHWDKQSIRKTKIRDFILNRKRISAYEINQKSLCNHVRTIRNSKATHIIGYPAAIYELCLLLQQQGSDVLRHLNLKAVFLTGEPVLSYQREVIEETTGAICVNQYGSAEAGLSVAECPARNLHIMSESNWFQTNINNEILITDMMLRAFPLIRYEIGDEANLSDDKCICGRPHPLVKNIVGRSGDPITLPNGSKINSHLPGYIFKPLSSLGVIRKYRFVHYSDNTLKLYLIVNENFTNEHMRIVEEETKKAFGDDIIFTIHKVDEIPHLPNAKHRSYIYQN